MPEYVLNRNHNLISKGYNIKFVKGQPVYVPPDIEREAVVIGAEPLEGEKLDPLGPEEVPEAQLTEKDKEELFLEVFEKMVATNNSADFSGDGKPAMDALKRELPFTFVRKERDAAWAEFRKRKADALEQE